MSWRQVGQHSNKVTSFPGSCSFTRTHGYNLTCHKNDCKLCKDTLWDFKCITNLTCAYQDPILSVATLTHHTGTSLHGVSQRSKRVLLTESSLNISHLTNFAKTCGTWTHCLILSQSLGRSYAKRPEPSASPTLVHYSWVHFISRMECSPCEPHMEKHVATQK